MIEKQIARGPADFSLVLGGPLFQIWRRTHLSGDALQHLRLRVVVMTLVAWAPLLVLSIVDNRAAGTSIPLPFLYDIETHVRFLLAVPLLIAGEIAVHRRLPPLVRQFVDRRLIADSAVGAFNAAVASAMRLRNSRVAEVLLVLCVYVIGVGLLWRTRIALDVASWHGSPVNGLWQPTVAGWWLGVVSLPLFQFLLVRWYFRLFVWARFLWQVSRLDLTLIPTHPDRCGGLGFLAAVSRVFAPLLAAQGLLLAGLIANRIFYAGATLPDFTVELSGLVAGMLFVVFGPLLVFTPTLEAVQRVGLSQYGALAQRYVRDFDQKWLRGGAPPGERFVGSPDIQSLADLANSYDVVRSMRWVPFTWSAVVDLAVTTLLPLLPLALTIFSLDEIVERLLKMLF